MNFKKELEQVDYRVLKTIYNEPIPKGEIINKIVKDHKVQCAHRTDRMELCLYSINDKVLTLYRKDGDIVCGQVH